MKKKVLFVCGVLLTAMMVVVGCGGDSGALNGTYKLSGAEVGGQEYTGDQLKSMMSLTGMNVDMTLTFSGSDKVAMKASVAGQEQNVEGTYALDGEELSLTMQGATQKAELKDGKIYIDSAGTTLILSK